MGGTRGLPTDGAPSLAASSDGGTAPSPTPLSRARRARGAGPRPPPGWEWLALGDAIAVQSGGAAGAPLPVRTHTVRIWRILQGGESFTPGFPLLTQALSSQFRRGVDRTCALLRN